ncbi:hypothetical protein MMC13_007946 [Lambiella insularis]|nr:hypothetical protein [Lambiella insularis]
MPPQLDSSMGSQIYGGRSSLPAVRQPNPPFVFPMQSLRNAGMTADTTNTSSTYLETTNGHLSTNRARPQQISLSPLDFHPSTADLTPTTSGSSPHSPSRSPVVQSRMSGHRRGGSEFIGGDGSTNGPGLMSSSPTKGEDVLPSPSGARRGPAGNRRGHVHRRSGAISVHDVSTVIRPPGEMTAARSGSAPTTPSDPNMHREFLPALDRSASQPVLPHSESSPPKVSKRRDSAPMTAQPRPRVGFSDTVEFIPRPLSTISSETSSSMSTIRASHSVTNSITSIVSGDTSIPQSARKTKTIYENPLEAGTAIARPRSADAVLDGFGPVGISGGRAAAGDRPPSVISSLHSSDLGDLGLRTPQIQSLSNKSTVDAIAIDFSGNYVHGTGSYSVPPPSWSHAQRTQEDQAMLSTLPVGRPRSSPEAKDTKRPTKVRSWAGSLLSKKVQSRSLSDHADVDASTPKTFHDFAISDDVSLDDINFDEDTTCVIRNPHYAAPRPALSDLSGSQAREVPYFQSPDAQSSILDLDAAFNVLNAPSDIEEEGGSRQLYTKRRMHSGGATGGFSGPGMHYHRRAESAPEMAPVDRHAFGLNRLGSNSTMADVFEEDEEDDGSKRRVNAATKLQNITQRSKPSRLGVQAVNADEKDHDSAEGSLGRRCVEVNDLHWQRSHIVTGTHLQAEPLFVNAPPEDTLPLDIVDAAEETCFSVVTKMSGESTATPKLPSDSLRNGLPVTPTDYSFQRSILCSDVPESQSPVSSPDFNNTSFEVPRLHTATSSITDRTTLSSRRVGGIGQGSTYSTEDVPSLTSSASTMISSHPPRFSSSAETRSSGERSMSFSAAVPRRTHPVSAGKRSSLASLSRLVGGSYGEKSKLSIESRAQSDDSDKAEKKKGNRMSRLMRFWKPKEKLAVS